MMLRLAPTDVSRTRRPVGALAGRPVYAVAAPYARHHLPVRPSVLN